MSRTKTLQGPCQHCQGTIRFPAENVGTSALCPYCGKPTELMIPAPEQEPMIPRRAMAWTAIALVVLLAGLAGIFYALNRARSLSKSGAGANRPAVSIPAAPR